MNDKRDRQHKKTPIPYKQPVQGRPAGRPYITIRNVVVGPCACRDTIIPRSRRIS